MEQNPYESPREEISKTRQSRTRFLLPALLGIAVASYAIGARFAPADPASVVIAAGMVLIFGLASFGLGLFVGGQPAAE